MGITNIEFRKLKIAPVTQQFFNIYYVIENNKSQVMDKFRDLTDDTKDEIKDLIIKMATIKDFKSKKIRWRMHSKYSYGELKPRGHRLFFFIKFKNNIIFFKYAQKQKDSLGNKFYNQIEREKLYYEQEFEKFIQGY
jgi:hypothetical protein